MKKIFRIMSLLIIACMITGCMRMEGTLDTSKSKKQYTTTMKVWFNKEKVDQYTTGATNVPNSTSQTGMDAASLQAMMTQIQAYPVVTIDGKQYYQGETQKNKDNYYPKNKNDSMIITPTSFYVGQASGIVQNDTANQSEEAIEFMSEFLEKIIIDVKFAEPVKKTNGTLSKNKKTVTFNFGLKKLSSGKTEMYAYTKSADRTLAEDRTEFKKLSKKKNK